MLIKLVISFRQVTENAKYEWFHTSVLSKFGQFTLVLVSLRDLREIRAVNYESST